MLAELHGLNQTDLNGSSGSVKAWLPDKQRWQVEVNGKMLCIKSTNLKHNIKDAASFEFEQALLMCDASKVSALLHCAGPNCILPFHQTLSPLELIAVGEESAQSLEVCKLLLEQGASVEIDSRGITPLWLACDAGNSNVTRLLLEANAQPDVVTQGSNFYPTALTTANREGNTECVRLLLQHGADPHIGMFGMRTDSDSNPFSSMMVRADIVMGDPDPNRKDMIGSQARRESESLITRARQ